MYQKHVYHADYLDLRLPCGLQLGPRESLSGHRPEVNCGACRAILVAHGYAQPDQFFGEAVSPRVTRTNVATPEQQAYAIERVRWGAVGDLVRMQREYRLLPVALAATAAAGELTVERAAELREQLGWNRATQPSGWLLNDLPAVAEVAASSDERGKTTIQSDHPLPTGKSVKVDAKGGETVIFTYA